MKILTNKKLFKIKQAYAELELANKQMKVELDKLKADMATETALFKQECRAFNEDFDFVLKYKGAKNA